MNDLVLSVRQKDGITTFENHSDYTLCVYMKPIYPRRKYTKILIIPPHSFKIYTPFPGLVVNPDLTQVIFSLEK